jgi:hypothetical protein
MLQKFGTASATAGILAHLVADYHCHTKLISQTLQCSQEFAQTILALSKLATSHVLSPAHSSSTGGRVQQLTPLAAGFALHSWCLSGQHAVVLHRLMQSNLPVQSCGTVDYDQRKP